MKNVAVILAGGIGSRLDSSHPKQFFKVAGKTVIEHTIDVFESAGSIDEIVVVINTLFQERMEELVLKNGWSKVKKILKGGTERYHSSLVAIQAYSDDDINLIFHDAVRPLISNQIIDRTVKALESYNAVDVAVPAVDTIISVENNLIRNIPDRSCLMRGQTPQGFKLTTIRKAYELAVKDPDFKATDDCGVVLKYLPDEQIYVIKGDEANMKLTYKEDTYLLDKLFQLRSFSLSEESMDLTLLEDKVIIIFGGSYGIGATIAQLAEQYQAKVYIFSRSSNCTDISIRDNVRVALKQVYDIHGRIDYVVNTAAVLYKEALNSMNYEDILKIVNTNYLGMVNVALESYTYLKDSRGQLLFYTSSSYTRGRAFYSIYSSTKSACVNFVQAIAQEWDVYGIRVNCINPERTNTPMRVKNFGMENPQTLLTPEKVAVFSIRTLLSDFTGQIIDVKLES